MQKFRPNEYDLDFAVSLQSKVKTSGERKTVQKSMFVENDQSTL
jgi:hypothetical protein